MQLTFRSFGIAAKRMLHYKARQEIYVGTKDVRRFPVPEDKVSWSTPWPEYQPVDYTAPPVLSRPVWADPDFRFARCMSVLFRGAWAVSSVSLHDCA